MSRLHKNKQYLNANWTVEKVQDEINQGLTLLNKIDNKIITFFGSHRVSLNSPHYQHCMNVAYHLGKRAYAIISGGGPGIMHAANSGATKANVPSLGLRADLLKGEEVTDHIFTEKLSFHFLFARRFIMSIKNTGRVYSIGWKIIL